MEALQELALRKQPTPPPGPWHMAAPDKAGTENTVQVPGQEQDGRYAEAKKDFGLGGWASCHRVQLAQQQTESSYKFCNTADSNIQSCH